MSMSNSHRTERNNNTNSNGGNILGGRSVQNTVTPSMFKNKESPNMTKRVFQPVQYTDGESRRIQGLLDKVLGPEYVSFRPGGGGQKVSYIEGWKALNLANEIFGFNGWSSELISSQVDYFDTHGNAGRYSMGLSVVVRITIKDGTYHEDFGYGYIDNAKNKAMAFEKCRKEAFTDGLKRCLRCFGNVLGNCLYDRNIISKIQQVKATPVDYQDNDFYRDSRVAERQLLKKESTRVNILEKANPVVGDQSTEKREPETLDQTHSNATTSTSSDKRTTNERKNKADGSDKTGRTANGNTSEDTDKHHDENDESDQQGKEHEIRDFDDSFVFSDDLPMDDLDDLEMNRSSNLDDYDMEMLLHKSQQNETSGNPKSTRPANRNKSSRPPPQQTPRSDNAPQNSHPITPMTNNAIPTSLFVSAKKADVLQNTSQDASEIPRFDTKFISPNIRRTIDPTKSIPIKRADINVAGKTSVTATSSQVSEQHTPLSSQNTNNNTLGKRMIGVPPTSRPKVKRLHRDVPANPAIDSESSKDKENRSIA